MRDFLNVYDRDVKKIAVLQNAFDITETQELNKIYSLSFSLPNDDMKNQYCRPFNYVRWREDGELYRIIKITSEGSDTGKFTYECEHVIATLCDSVLFGSFTYGGGTIKTPEVIGWLLSQQKVKNWELSDCDFERRFEYGWEQENLLNAIYSIPKEFTNTYQWVFDTKTYPWKLSLKLIDVTKNPEYYIRAKQNLIQMDSTESDTEICTRLYPLGYGEGVNQLTIREVNNDCEYLQSPAEIVARYGLIEKVLVDRRFEDPESLKAYGLTILEGLQSPSYSRSFDVADLYPLTSQDIDNAAVGKICKLTMDETIVYITKTVRKLDDPGNLQIELSNKSTDIVSSIADLADRVRIESVYAQGATQLYQHSKDANATKDKGMEINLYFPEEMKQINKVMLKLQLEQFRSYSATTKFNEVYADTTLGGGGTSDSSTHNALTVSAPCSSESIEGIATSYMSELGQIPISISVGTDFRDADVEPHHAHNINKIVYISPSLINHTHKIDAAKFNQHTHDVELPAHSHKFDIPEHKHGFTIPAHNHTIEPGIFEYGNPTGFDIYVDGEKKDSIPETSYEDDITKYLLNDQRMVPRNSWIKLEIRPNDLAYVVSSVFVQGFVQSRGGGNY